MKRVHKNLIEEAACTPLIVFNKVMMVNLRKMFKEVDMIGAGEIIKKKNFQETLYNQHTKEYDFVYTLPKDKAMHNLCVAISKFNNGLTTGELPTEIYKCYGFHTYRYDAETEVIDKIDRVGENEPIAYSIQHILNVFFKDEGVVSIVLNTRKINTYLNQHHN